MTLLASLFIACAFPCRTALAQADLPSVLEEVVVTAQKRSELLTDVAMSITAVSGDELRTLIITDAKQLESVVPGFTYQLSNYGVPVYTIRGVGFYDRSLGNAPAVNIYIDEAPLPYSAMTRGALLDLERMEVLKGPQGTLFGQNSTGGAINYIAAKPTEEFNAGVNISYGRFNELIAEGYLSGPLSENVRARVALRSETRDDWQQSWTSDRTNGERNFLTARLLIDWTPTDDLRFELGVSGWKDKSDSQAGQYNGFIPSRALEAGGNPPAYEALAGNPQGYPVPPTDAREADWDPDFDLANDDHLTQFTLRADWQLEGDMTFTSLTSYSDYDDYVPVDTDGTDFADQNTIRDGSINSFFQELRLSGSINDRADWMIGGNYQDDTADELLMLHIEATNNSVGPFRYEDFNFVNDQKAKTWAAFGALDYNLSNTVTLQGSARYTTQDRDFEGCMKDPGDGVFAAGFTFLSTVVLMSGADPIPPGACTTLESPQNAVPVDIVNGTLDEDNWSWRVSLNWEPNDQTLYYANVSTGYKNGSFPTIPGVFSSQYAPVTQESILAYEVGMKLGLADGRVQLNSAAFYYDYDDKQILGTTLYPIFGPLPVLVNIPRSKIQGIEADITAQPIRGLRLNAGVVYLNSDIKEDPIDPRGPFGEPTTFVGEEFPATPKWQVLGDGEYRFNVGDDLLGIAGVHFSYRDSTNATLGEDPLHVIDSYFLIDLRAGVASEDGTWQALVWVRNLTDEYYWNNAFRSIDTVARMAGMPRTYGISFSYNYF